MTATPRFYTPRLRREAGLLDVDVASMDDESVFGAVLHRLTFREAIDCDLLSDYQVVVVGVDNETYRAWAERGEFVTPDGVEVTDARTLAGQIAVAKIMRKYKLRRVISFHSRVNAARKFSDDVPYVSAWMPARARPQRAIWSEHVSGAMSSGHRDRLLVRFRDLGTDEIGLLSNARCLGEGVDVPTLDGVAFIDPRRSTIDIIQAVGRAIRKAPDKTLGTIVLPVFLADEEDPDRMLDESAFKNVWNVLKALRAHDEALGEELDELRRRLGAHRSAARRPGKIKLDVPVSRVGTAFVKAFNARLVEQTTASWEFWFGLLQRFVGREAHARVPLNHVEEGYRLGRWVVKQRSRLRFRQRGEFAERRCRLETLPGWLWDTSEADWEDGFAHLERFVARERHARVPKEHCGDGYRLGAWVGVQRQARRKGTLRSERRARLEALPLWTWEVPESAWEKGFAALQRFVEREGHARVAHDHREDGFRLGRWVSHQRVLQRRGDLSDEHARRLESLPGWTSEPYAADWEDGYARLLVFVEREGHARVPSDYRDDDGFRVGKWVQRQRISLRNGQLEGDARLRLESLPGWISDTREAAWEDGYARLVEFVAHAGHSRVPQDYRDDHGFRLGLWVQNQRARGPNAARRRGALSDARIHRLESVGGWSWHPHEASWEDGHRRLKEFVAREGHARVPQRAIQDGFHLGAWVNSQRQQSMQQTLDPQRRAQLEALRGWSWQTREAAWDEGYSRLREFAAREGHTRVPRGFRDEDGFRLGLWVQNNRARGHRGTLADERVHQLESVAGWIWDTHEAAWEDAYARLREFVAREEHGRVPRSYRDDDGFNLGQWVQNTRARGRRGDLSQERARRLESLPGWTWNARQPARAR